MSELFCQQASLDIGEPLAGTAVAGIDRWLLLEHDGPWGVRGLDDSGLPEQVVQHLAELSQRFPRLRVQLIRRPDARPEGARLYLAECAESGGRLSRVELPSSADLLELPLTPWLLGAAELPGELERQPLYFVCVHGKRDRCCARLGMPVYRAIEAQVGERVYQTTHLGGHRFAATLLVLPLGLSYGRVEGSEAQALVASSERGEIYDLTRLRGRTSYASEAQAAEILLRSELDSGRTTPLTLRVVEDGGERGTRVAFLAANSQREHELFVHKERLPPASQSCGAQAKAASKLVPLRAR